MRPDNNEYRVFGSPGTGKTFYLSGQIQRAIDRTHQIPLVCVFTRAAAIEIASRAGLKCKDCPTVGTMHAICHRMLGRPKLVAGQYKKWNEWIAKKGYHELKLFDGSSGGDLDEPDYTQSKKTKGEALAATMEVCRGQLRPLSQWPSEVLAFHNLWADWKRQAGLVDFTDLIESSKASGMVPQASIAFLDEAQDYTALELSLARQWAPRFEKIILAGDDDQNLYQFRGALPDAFIRPPLDSEFKIILSQSYRVPKKIHAFADRWVKNIQFREPKEYHPTDEPGEIRLQEGPDQLGFIMKNLHRALDEKKEVMVLASCGYMLEPLLKRLRAEGIPFHNHYRKKRGDWNPLQRGSSKRTTTTDRILAFMNPATPDAWTWKEFQKWAKDLRSGDVLPRGAKKEIEEAAAWEGDQEADLHQFFEEALIDIYNEDMRPGWMQESILKSKMKSYEFPFRVLKQNGLEGLTTTPLITVGTIHSVKGGESDMVIVLPDLSPQGFREWTSRDGKDGVFRQFYVAYTRAKRELCLCRPSSRLAINFQTYR